MTRPRPKRVYYHETFDVCDGLPDLLHRFALRALLVAKPGERVVLPHGFGPPAELQLLNRCGFGPRPDDLIFVGSDGAIVDGDSDIEGAEILPFSGTTRRARRFAEMHGATFHAPLQPQCLEANSKAAFQDIVNDARAEADWQVGPRGTVSGIRAAAEIATRFAAAHGKSIVKGVHSASGLQQAVVGSGETPALDGMPDEVVIQEWVAHDYSPSLQCLIERDGRVRELSTTIQILDGNHHVGNVCPSGLPREVVSQMSAKGRYICRSLSARGFWGICGVDFLVRESDGTVLANEVNARIPAPWYPWNASRRRFGVPLPFRMKSVRLRPGMPFAEVERAVRPSLFDRARRSGFLPFCFVPEHGFVYGATFAATPEALATLASHVDVRLAELAP
ncbi:MAG: hypothetical protein RL272_127 [Candidatus Parcubacteria bacterium]|jgi:hypothetical protein